MPTPLKRQHAQILEEDHPTKALCQEEEICKENQICEKETSDDRQAGQGHRINQEIGHDASGHHAPAPGGTSGRTSPVRERDFEWKDARDTLVALVHAISVLTDLIRKK